MTPWRMAQMNTSRILTADQARRQAADEFRQRPIDRAIKRLLKVALQSPEPPDQEPDERPAP